MNYASNEDNSTKLLHKKFKEQITLLKEQYPERYQKENKESKKTWTQEEILQAKIKMEEDNKKAKESFIQIQKTAIAECNQILRSKFLG